MNISEGDISDDPQIRLKRLKVELANAARHCDAFERRMADILEDQKAGSANAEYSNATLENRFAENRFADSIATAMARARKDE